MREGGRDVVITADEGEREGGREAARATCVGRIDRRRIGADEHRDIHQMFGVSLDVRPSVRPFAVSDMNSGGGGGQTSLEALKGEGREKWRWEKELLFFFTPSTVASAEKVCGD